VLIVLWRFARAPTVMNLFVLLLLGFGAQLFQLHHYVNISERQRSLLRVIVENFDAATPSETLLVLDDTGQLGPSSLLVMGCITRSATSMPKDRSCRDLPHTKHGVAASRFARSQRTLRRRRHGLDPQFSAFRDWTGQWRRQPCPSRHAGSRRSIQSSSRLTRLASPLRARRRQTIGVDSRRARRSSAVRYRNILAPRPPGPISPMFRDEFVGERYRWDFGDCWSLDLAPAAPAGAASNGSATAFRNDREPRR